MNPTCVFSSQHPDVLAVCAENDRRYAEFRARCKEFQADYPGRELLVVRLAWSTTAFGLDGKTAPGPHWREHQRGVWVPRLNSGAGKALAKRLDELKVIYAPYPGMPTEIFDEAQMRMRSPGTRLLGLSLFAGWACSEELVLAHGVDLDLWERCPLSVFHLALEVAQAAAAEAA